VVSEKKEREKRDKREKPSFCLHPTSFPRKKEREKRDKREKPRFSCSQLQKESRVRLSVRKAA
jgi:hypothetical protein